MATLSARVHDIEETLDGNGHKGLKTRIALLEQGLSELKWWARGTGSAIILWVLAQWLNLI